MKLKSLKTLLDLRSQEQSIFLFVDANELYGSKEYPGAVNISLILVRVSPDTISSFVFPKKSE